MKRGQVTGLLPSQIAGDQQGQAARQGRGGGVPCSGQGWELGSISTCSISTFHFKCPLSITDMGESAQREVGQRARQTRSAAPCPLLHTSWSYFGDHSSLLCPPQDLPVRRFGCCGCRDTPVEGRGRCRCQGSLWGGTGGSFPPWDTAQPCTGREHRLWEGAAVMGPGQPAPQTGTVLGAGPVEVTGRDT